MDIGKPITDCSCVGAGRGHAGQMYREYSGPLDWRVLPSPPCPAESCPPQMLGCNPSLVSWRGLSVLRQILSHFTPAPTQDPLLLLPAVKCGPCEYVPNMWILFVFLVYSRNNINQWPNICGWCWVWGHVTRDTWREPRRTRETVSPPGCCLSLFLAMTDDPLVCLRWNAPDSTPRPATLQLRSYVIILHRNTVSIVSKLPGAGCSCYTS